MASAPTERKVLKKKKYREETKIKSRNILQWQHENLPFPLQITDRWKADFYPNYAEFNMD